MKILYLPFFPTDIVVKIALFPFSVLISFLELICPPKLLLIFSATISDTDFSAPFCKLESDLSDVTSETFDSELFELLLLEELEEG